MHPARLIGIALPLGLAALSFRLVPQDAPLVLGEGDHAYRWVREFGELPEGAAIGNTHGCVLVDGNGRILLNTDTENAIMAFDAEGGVLATWGAELKGGLHGMCLRVEDGEQYLYLAHTGSHRVLKTTITGEVVWELGWPEASGKYENEGQYKPTSVAVGPSGELFVADGYGRSWVHRFDAERNYLGSFGGPGGEHGQLKTPHGIFLDTRGADPLLCVADRENHRLQWFDLEGEFVRALEGELRRPCHVHQWRDRLVVADLAGRITLIDGDDEVIAHLGDQPDEAKRARNGIPREHWKEGEFLSPHCATFDRDGNIYVADWNSAGRITKLERILNVEKR